MVISYCYAFSTLLRPSEAESILVVDADTMLTRSVAFQSLKPIAWRKAKVCQFFNQIQLLQLS